MRASQMVLKHHRELRSRSLADLVLVADRLRPTVPLHEPTGDEADACLAAGKRFFTHTGKTSREKYASWRNDQPDREELPPVSTILSHFGYWTRFRAAARIGPEYDPAASRLVSNGRAIDREDTLRALHEYADSFEGRILQRGFIAYCRSQMRAPESSHRRLPWNRGALPALFGPWEQLLIKEGLGDRSHRRSTAAERARMANRWGTATLLALLEGAVAERGVLSDKAFDARAEKLDYDMPSSATYMRRFGDWRHSLRLVGVPEEEIAKLRDTTPFTDEEIRSAALAFIADHSVTGGYDTYRRVWQPQQQGRVPSVRTIALRLGNGSWPRALLRVSKGEI